MADSDEEYARCRARHDSLCNARAVVRSKLFMGSAEKSATAREHQAQNSQYYRDHLELIDNANADMLILQNKRSTAHTLIDCWRSLNAARNKGQIL